MAGHRARRPRERHRLHLRRRVPADRDRPGRQRAERRRPRVPDHPVEHGADPLLHDRDRGPDLDRRPREPDRDQRRRPGDRHRDRQGALPVEQRRPRAVQPERAAAAGVAEHAVGLVPHQRRAHRQRPRPADRRPRHLDDLQGRRPHRPDPLAARRQGEQLHARSGARPDARRRERALRLAARSRVARARRLHVLRQRVGRRRPASRTAARSP